MFFIYIRKVRVSFQIFLNEWLHIPVKNRSNIPGMYYYPHMPIGMLGIYRLVFVCVCLTVSARYFVRDIFGVG